MPNYQYEISEEQAGLRLDKAISNLCQDTSRAQIQKSIKNGQLTLNGQIISNLSVRVKHNDKITLLLEEEKPQDILPVDIPLDIVFEDEHLIVVNKSANMITHPGAGDTKITLVNALLYHTNNLSDVGGCIRPGIVHRLDKDTSGLMVVAKNNAAHRSLSEQIETRELKRKYKALVWGMLKPLSGAIEGNIARSTADRTKMTVVRSGGKHAITHYKTLDVFCGGLFTLVECKLETGRTHQIRVHLSKNAHSVVGDQTYGNNARKIKGCDESFYEKLAAMKRQCLHSYYISFVHPVTKERLEFEKNVPEDYNQLIEFLNNKK